ncbi:unnamed protein product [Allacma fusca]|uniref:Uncharacterized protein n=1 Tax=Allacma fusca TaxID=39272 RepID=A0A8J2P0Y6_9HEXA|nr:unnamed protein product [Allacma fusca]
MASKKLQIAYILQSYTSSLEFFISKLPIATGCVVHMFPRGMYFHSFRSLQEDPFRGNILSGRGATHSPHIVRDCKEVLTFLNAKL